MRKEKHRKQGKPLIDVEDLKPDPHSRKGERRKFSKEETMKIAHEAMKNREQANKSSAQHIEKMGLNCSKSTLLHALLHENNAYQKGISKQSDDAQSESVNHVPDTDTDTTLPHKASRPIRRCRLKPTKT